MKEKIDLNGIYKLTSLDYGESIDKILSKDFIPLGWLDSFVPEDVRTALKRNGILSGYHYGKNLDDERFIDEKNWIYHKRFHVDASLLGKKNVIAFDGIDTIAEVYLNGKMLFKCDNMFIPHEVDVSDELLYGSTNILVILVISPIKSIEHIDRAGLFPAEDTGRLLLRKSQMNYGWDFCGHCLTTGLWKDVSLVSIDDDTLGDIFLSTKSISNGNTENNLDVISAEISLNVNVNQYGDNFENTRVCLTFCDGENLVAELSLDAQKETSGILKIMGPKLWWPRPYGEPFLYDVKITLEKNGTVIDSKNLRFGIRTVELIQDKIPAGGRNFVVSINNKQLFVRGGNWVPINSVYGEIKDEDYDPLIKRAVDANLSMLRIWGGGIYESEHFFDLCDEHGIMIMQDFMLACGVLPQEQWYLDKVYQEVLSVVRHYRNRTCLVIWSGDNELDEAYRWYDILPQFKTNKVNRIAVKSAVEKTDTTRPFLVSSPCSPFEDEDGNDDPNSPLQGDMHIYLTRFSQDSEWYYKKLREFIPRFMSEYGFSSLPCLDTVKKYNFFNRELDLTLNPWLGELPEFHKPPISDNLTNLIFATQYTHAAALKYGIEYMRSYKGICGGLLYWKFNDPYAPNRENMLFTGMMSCVDFFGKPKMVYYYSKRAYADVILAFRETLDGKVSICNCNETEKEYSGIFSVSYLDFDGNEKMILEKSMVLSKDCAEELYSFNQADWSDYALKGYIKASFISNELHIVNRYMLAEIQQVFHLSLPNPNAEVHLIRKNNELIISINSQKYLHNVELDILDVDIYYSDNFFQMDAGEYREIKILVNNEKDLLNKYLSVKIFGGKEFVFDLNEYVTEKM